jgi:hypothetical protein
MAGMIDLVARGEIDRSSNVPYVQLGGQAALSGYAGLLASRTGRARRLQKAAPQRERFPRLAVGRAGVHCRCYQPLETDRIDVIGSKPELVAATAGDDRGLASVEELAQAGLVELHHPCAALDGARHTGPRSTNRSRPCG